MKVLVVSYILSFVITYIVLFFTKDTKISNNVRSERWHDVPVSNVGGIAFFVVYFGFIIFSALPVNGLLLGTTLLFCMGLVDDLRDIDYRVKLVVQFLAAAAATTAGYMVNFFPSVYLNILFSYFWIVFFTNAFNLSDNMDGLASGIAIIAFTLLYFVTGNIFCLVFVGILLGFLVWNFPPAKIFMGDCGSMVIGYWLAIMTLFVKPGLEDFIYMLFIIIVPVFDTCFVMMRRIRRKKSIMIGGKDHISHGLSRLFGYNDRLAVLVIWWVALVFGLFGCFKLMR